MYSKPEKPYCVMFSSTGKCHGWGSDPFKTVSGLTGAERRAVKAGGLVVVETPERGAHGGNSPYRYVMTDGKRWYRRVLTADMLTAFKKCYK